MLRGQLTRLRTAILSLKNVKLSTFELKHRLSSSVSGLFVPLKMKKQKAKPKRKPRKQAKEGGNRWGWVDDRLEWLPEKSQPNCESSDEFSIISWNVLADAYCSYRSHRNLPLKFQRHVFDRHQRQHHVRQILRRLVSSLGNPILALQEVDKPLEVLMALEELGYEGIETPTSPGGKNGRVDACGLYFHRDEWTCLQQEMIRLDDLATLRSRTGKEICDATRNSLRGFQTSFLKKNMAMLVRLKNVQSNKQIVVAVLHLYWNRE
jgi:mRNA deadenylase 3'-5' endonuclease subunit Ccr4